MYINFYIEPNYETIIAEKDKQITELTCRLDGLQKKPSIDSSVQFTLGKLILTYLYDCISQMMLVNWR